MGERIDEKALFEGASKAADLADLGGDDMEKRGFARAQFWRDEALRARSEEARLLQENRKQAEQIKALADASAKTLATLKAWHKNKGEWWDCQRLLSAALRLAGRLP